jgi:DNA-binding MarR family transcriptional regulator
MNKCNEQFANSYSLFALIRGLNFEIEKDIRRQVEKRKLTFPGFRILWILYFDSNLRMSDLTYLAQTNISNIFRQLIKLKESGLVVVNSGNDARTKEVALTEEGRKVVKDFIDDNVANSDLQIVHLIDKISKEDQSKLMEVLTLMSNELVGEQFSEFVVKSSSDIKFN